MIRLLFAALCLVAGAASALAADSSPAPSASPVAAGPSVRPSGAPSAAASPFVFGAPQPYAQFIKKAERQSGLIDVLRKDDDVYFDLTEAQLDRTYIVAPVLASGLGSDAFAGRVYPSFLLQFKRVGRRLLWIDKNSDFSAPPDSPAANALAISVTDSVINSTPIVAEDEAKKRVVVSAAFFLTDFENVGRDLGGPQQPLVLFSPLSKPSFSVDPARSYVERAKALPKNDEILASLAFSGPPGELSGAPDGRGVRLRMHYSIVDPPATGYLPRLADDRVGYFITAQKRFDDDALPSPFVRYIDRWNFANGPLVYYLTNEIPPQYKPAIRAALLEWNRAFEKIGIRNAIEVRDQPSDPSWDPDDVRYSTVRWLTSDRAPFVAYGPFVSDPRTGEILRAEIVIDGETMRWVKRGYADEIGRSPAARTSAGLVAAQATRVRCDDSAACDEFERDEAESAAAGTVALRAAGATPVQTQRFAEGYLRATVLHESGHNLGLRHNFRSATLYSLRQLHDPRFTAQHGLVGSVMGYTPLNLSPPGEPQGDYFQSKLGPYDLWAIRYGYEKLPNVRRPEDELVRLHGIADESSRPEYAFATDEDAHGFLAIDPRVAAYDLSNDPLAFDRNQFAVFRNLVARLDTLYPRDDRPYFEETQTFETMMRQYERAALLATKYVGGVYTSRAHRGQPGGDSPERPVPRADSERAFALLAANVFSSGALRFSPELLRDLGPNHYLHRGVDEVEPPDFPLQDFVAGLQDDVMYRMFAPETMTRLADARYKTLRGERAMSVDDLFGWMQNAVWDDLSPQTSSIEPLHRALQRRYAHLLIAMTLAPSFLLESIGYPGDTAPLARYELRRLARTIDVALRSRTLDVPTRAHLEDVQSRIRSALGAGSVRSA